MTARVSGPTIPRRWDCLLRCCGCDPLLSRLGFVMAASAATVSLSSSLVLLTVHRTLSGPGDQLDYYRQAGQLLPFTDNYYGPGYFIALRVVHDLTRLDWFEAGKL